MMLADGRVVGVIFWLGLAMALLVVGLMWGLRLKKRLNQEDEPAPAMGFTLSDLRQMHRAGQINDAEFAKAKEKIVEAAKKAAERDPALAAAKDSPDAIRARRLANRGFDVVPPPGREPGAEAEQ